MGYRLQNRNPDRNFCFCLLPVPPVNENSEPESEENAEQVQPQAQSTVQPSAEVDENSDLEPDQDSEQVQPPAQLPHAQPRGHRQPLSEPEAIEISDDESQADLPLNLCDILEFERQDAAAGPGRATRNRPTQPTLTREEVMAAGLRRSSRNSHPPQATRVFRSQQRRLYIPYTSTPQGNYQI